MRGGRTAKAARAARRAGGAPADTAQRPSDTHPPRLARGEWYEGIVDATIYLGMDGVLGRVDHRLRELLIAGQPIPTYYAYLTHRGFLNWVTLSEDPRYSYSRAGVELCDDKAGEIAASVIEAVGRRDIDFVSLGPGTGLKDRSLVLSLLDGMADGRVRSATTRTTSTRR